MFQSNYFTQAITGDDILHKVEYTEDENKIIPRLMSADPEKQTSTISLGMVGKYKRYDWNYQREWRYIIQFLPGNILTVFSDGGITFRNIFIDIVNGRAKQPFSYYDLEIDDDAFSNMKVVLSPTLSPGNEVLIRTAIEMYNPSAKILDSTFKGKIG
ncbi:MAG: hypothetical protein LBQ71_15545 [Hungatella sp.]|jgi:hypothetical protein|nr:hypothetical protein [Hungatella sp.]